MPTKTALERRRMRTAYHEAGHAVAAYLQRVKVKKVTIIPEGDVLGSAYHENILMGEDPDLDSSDRLRLKLEKQAIISLAGFQAERRFDRMARDRGSASDYQRATQIMSYAVGNKEMLTAYMRFLGLKAKALLNRPGAWQVVEAVATKLVAKGKLSGAETRRTIQAVIQRLSLRAHRHRTADG